MQQSNVHIKLIEFDLQGVVYRTAANLDSGVNSITFINEGTTNVRLQPIGILLFPGQQFVASANVGEIDKTRYVVNFEGVGNNACNVITKNYKK